MFYSKEGRVKDSSTLKFISGAFSVVIGILCFVVSEKVILSTLSAH